MDISRPNCADSVGSLKASIVTLDWICRCLFLRSVPVPGSPSVLAMWMLVMVMPLIMIIWKCHEFFSRHWCRLQKECLALGIESYMNYYFMCFFFGNTKIDNKARKYIWVKAQRRSYDNSLRGKENKTVRMPTDWKEGRLPRIRDADIRHFHSLFLSRFEEFQ